jgi:hypothetical protein
MGDSELGHQIDRQEENLSEAIRKSEEGLQNAVDETNNKILKQIQTIHTNLESFIDTMSDLQGSSWFILNGVLTKIASLNNISASIVTPLEERIEAKHADLKAQVDQSSSLGELLGISNQ